MDAAAIVSIVMQILTSLAPKVYDLVMRGIAGDDISHDDLMKALDNTSQTAVLDRIKTEQRRANGLPV